MLQKVGWSVSNLFLFFITTADSSNHTVEIRHIFKCLISSSKLPIESQSWSQYNLISHNITTPEVSKNKPYDEVLGAAQLIKCVKGA